MRKDQKINRRNLLQLGMAATVSTLSFKIFGCSEAPQEDPAQAAKCIPTKYETMGPFHPNKDQADKDADLSTYNGSEVQQKGELIYVRGTVSDEDCNPIPGALVMIWHANTHGKYTHDYDNNTVEDDPNFQGWGQMKTNEKGEYGFKTIKPGKYIVFEDSDEWRTPHIHFKVSLRGYHELITQMYFAEETELNEKDMFASQLSEQEKAQVIRTRTKGVEGIEEDASMINFDITIQRVKKKEKDLPVLAEYIGSYQIDLNNTAFEEELNIFYGGTRAELSITISKENGVLKAEMPIQPKCEIYPKSKDRYVYRAFEADIEFERDTEGKVVGLVFHRHYDFPVIKAAKV